MEMVQEELQVCLPPEEAPGAGEFAVGVSSQVSWSFPAALSADWAINNRNLFLTFLKAGSLVSGRQHGGGCAKNPLPSCRLLTAPCSSYGRKSQRAV